MKTLVALLLIMTAYLQPIAAAPAVPIWAMSAGIDGLSNNYFVSDSYYANKSFQANEIKFLTVSKAVSDSTSLSIGLPIGKSLLGGINVGAAYAITPNATLSVGYSFYNNDNYELKNYIKTQLFIHF